MNPNRKFVSVAPVYVELARKFGKEIVAWYASPEGRASAARSRSGNRGTERNPILQGHGKLGEAVLALYCNMDPIKAVHWEIGRPDKGADIVTSFGLRIDVKTTLPPFKLIWPHDINDLYWKKEFDVLVSVSVDEWDWRRCWLEGWVTKQYFFDNKQIADGKVGGNLERGTWFMDKRRLDDIAYLWCAKEIEGE